MLTSLKMSLALGFSLLTQASLLHADDHLTANPAIINKMQYTISNYTKTDWKFDKGSLDAGSKTLGALEVSKNNGEMADILSVGSRTVPKEGKLTFTVKPDPDGKVALAIKLTSPEKVEYVMYLNNINNLRKPGSTFPKNIDIIMKATASKVASWVFIDKFSTGYLEIQDPATIASRPRR